MGQCGVVMPKRLHEKGPRWIDSAPQWTEDKDEVDGRKRSEWGAKSLAARGVKPFPVISEVNPKKVKEKKYKGRVSDFPF